MMMHGSQVERPRLAPGVRYRWDQMREQHQLLFPEGLLVLNETGAAIVRLCDGRTTDEMIHILNSLEILPSVNKFTKNPVEPNNIASKGTDTKKVTMTEITRNASLL